MAFNNPGREAYLWKRGHLPGSHNLLQARCCLHQWSLQECSAQAPGWPWQGNDGRVEPFAGTAEVAKASKIGESRVPNITTVTQTRKPDRNTNPSAEKGKQQRRTCHVKCTWQAAKATPHSKTPPRPQGSQNATTKRQRGGDDDYGDDV